MKSDPFFSIIIPTYNRAALVVKTIRSVLEQEYANFELIVVDDGSTDDTTAAVGQIKDGRIRYFRKENGERGAARNFGFLHSRGDYVNFLDSDDLIYPHHLSSAAEFVKSRDQPQVFHLGYDVKTREGRRLRTVKYIRNINRSLLRGNVLGCNGVFIRRTVMAQNLFNTDRALASLEDWELWLRLCAQIAILHGEYVTSAIIQHDQRSVMTGSVPQIEAKVEKFIHYVTADPTNRRVLGKKLRIPVASACSYAALHMAMAGAARGKILRYLWRAIVREPAEIFRRRFIVIVKFLLFR